MTKRFHLTLLVFVFANCVRMVAQSNQPPMTNADVVRMVTAGLSEDTIVTAIQAATTTNFDTGTDALIGLRVQNVPDKVINTMLESHRKTNLAQQQVAAPAPRSVDDGSALIWSGVGVLGAGVMLEILSYTTLRNEAFACVFGSFGAYSCVNEYSTNKPVLFAGIGVAVLGGVLFDIGWNKRQRARPSISIGPRSVRVKQTFRF